jgi:hypothetical protein
MLTKTANALAPSAFPTIENLHRRTVGLPHLQAALAVWDYCSTSASHLFGDSTGDAIADRILVALVESPMDYRNSRSVASSTVTSAAIASTRPSNN